MKILLLIPPTDLTKSYGDLKKFSNPQPGIGFAYIAAVLRENGYGVKVVDAYVNGYGLTDIMDIIKQYVPDVVGISVLTPSAEVVYEIARNMRKEYTQIKIVMGNMHASLFADEILSKNYADFIVHREGERTMLNLVETIEKSKNIQNVNGISFRKDGVTVENTLGSHIEDLDSLPFPAWDLFPLDKYSTDPRTEVKKDFVEMQILATRGCPNQCTFCSSRTERSLGRKKKKRDPKLVVDEMVYMHKRYGSKVFSFMDLAFPMVRQHAVDLCNEIIKRGLNGKLKWVTECRVKPLDQELLCLLKEAGCERLCFGIEAGNNNTLKRLKKNFSTDDVKKAVKMAHNAGLEIDGMFMIGLPGETEEMIKETIYFAIKLNVRYAIFNLFVPYPGCDLWDELNKQNKIIFEKWSEFTSYPTYSGGKPVYIPDDLTHEQLVNLQRYAMRKFYLRPKFVYHELKRLKLSKIKEYYYGLKALIS